MSFETAVEAVLKTEGGYVDDPVDMGGATNFGITLRTLQDYRGKPVTKEDVQNLTVLEAKKIYKEMYWDRLFLDQVRDPNVAYFLFDQAVNRGPRKAIETIQKVVRVTADGIMGPLTLKSINAYNPRELLVNAVKNSQLAYVDIVLNNPQQLKFLKGWITRTHKALDLV